MSVNYKEKSALEIETISFAVEAAAGIAVIVLAIIGLDRADPWFVASIASIVLGVAWLAQGATTASEYPKLLPLATRGTLGAVELGGGMAAEILSGGAVIILGILSLLGYHPQILMSVAVIVVGVSVILAAAGFERLNTLRIKAPGSSEVSERVARGAVGTAIAIEMLAGGAGAVLGILALTLAPIDAATLTLIAFLVLGAGLMVNGVALTGRMFRLFDVEPASANPQAAE